MWEDVFFEVFAHEDFAALAVDDFALLVHDVVVFEDVFAGCRKLRAFDFFSGRFDGAG